VLEYVSRCEYSPDGESVDDFPETILAAAYSLIPTEEAADALPAHDCRNAARTGGGGMTKLTVIDGGGGSARQHLNDLLNEPNGSLTS
jgi:hypothetical protein